MERLLTPRHGVRGEASVMGGAVGDNPAPVAAWLPRTQKGRREPAPALLIISKCAGP